jgi:hypothetical protein
MKVEMIERYAEAFRKFEAGEITLQQWTDLCLLILGEIMEEHKEIFVRLKNR